MNGGRKRMMRFSVIFSLLTTHHILLPQVRSTVRWKPGVRSGDTEPQSVPAARVRGEEPGDGSGLDTEEVDLSGSSDVCACRRETDEPSTEARNQEASGRELVRLQPGGQGRGRLSRELNAIAVESGPRRVRRDILVSMSDTEC
ncbi:unnamed protein product [Pleuronectes platessa]|uniref:Uncharacterized protein n=1 Tax=Pleuronectes platessa TaxID=8262 RepID=A0A9N7TID0_PLEPL|nr:unnamed protein product [Pleuronectes platessa]